MVYTFEDYSDESFFCRCCFNITHLAFETVIKGDSRTSNPVRRIQINHNAARVYCGRCGSAMVNVDRTIIDQVKEFNVRGYITKFSCGGHARSESVIVQMDGIRHMPDGDFSNYPNITKEDLEDYVSHKRDDKAITIHHVKNLPQMVGYLSPPNLIFHSHMPLEKKIKLWNAITEVLHNKVDRSYSIFYVKSYNVDEMGKITNETFGEPTDEHCTVSIMTKKCDATKASVPPSFEQEKKYLDVIKSFSSLLDDVIKVLDKPKLTPIKNQSKEETNQ